MSSPVIDENLWFLHRGCVGRHFLLGNPHTFPGRMMGWCLHKDRSFFFSKSEVESSSPEAAAWIEGFLAGNEPRPPRDPEGDLDFKSEEYASWRNQTSAFRLSGAWPNSEER